jgi:tetratricopeptide (TPR) repeat protein
MRTSFAPRWIVFLAVGMSPFSIAQSQMPSPATSPPTGPPPMPEFIRQGQQLIRDGKPQEALDLYKQTMASPHDLFGATIAAGSVLDLMGKGDQARSYFAKAIETAGSPEQKAQALRATAISYAFEANCAMAVEYERQVLDYFASLKNFYQQGEIADETARICLDAGDPDTAEKWYKRGHELGLQEPNISAARQDLWNFRWEHAQARIAARRGNNAEAQKHVAAAKAVLDKGTIPEQAAFFPYLEGYVAFYRGDYKAALEDLGKANQNDPFIQCLIAETYEKLGDKEKAMEFYRKAATASSHNPPAAYAVPRARKKLAARA